MIKKVSYAVLSFAPVLAFAANFDQVILLANSFKKLLNALIPVLFGLAIVFFFWGVVKYIRAAGDPKAAADGKSIMIYGIIGLAVMAATYGLINFLTTSAGLGGEQVNLPVLPNDR